MAASSTLAGKWAAGSRRERKAFMPRPKALVTTMNISHSPRAFTSESVAPINGASIKVFCNCNGLLIGRAPKQ
ncbi:hypothetical protein D3C75_1257870 [compost metagenome]